MHQRIRRVRRQVWVTFCRNALVAVDGSYPQIASVHVGCC
jgi:hypothetical protein